jgi:steroid 5-alpha reductase family enzyme
LKSSLRNQILAFPILVLVGGMLARAGSDNGKVVEGISVFTFLVAMAFLIQWVAFVPAFIFQTEKFFDITGSITYLLVTSLAVVLSRSYNGRSLLLLALVSIWALRLGIFLLRRVRKAGKDDRFDQIKPSFMRFLNTWTIQALWISFTLAAALAAMTSNRQPALDRLALLGFLVWVAGFSVEVVADAQKNRFQANPENKGKFIQTGLWSRSRHPNYFGEILLWIGVAIIALPTLQGWQWLTLISPLFVILLLTRVSGIPLLEKKAQEKWGGQEDYEAYKKRTPVLIPRVWKLD